MAGHLLQLGFGVVLLDVLVLLAVVGVRHLGDVRRAPV